MNVEFKKFLRDNKDYYLVHILFDEEQNKSELGFFNPKKDKMVIFKNNPFEKSKEEDVFKEGKTITKLDMDKIKINYEEATNKIKDVMKKDFSDEEVKKKIMILQFILEPVWNVTLICKSMNIINIRINSETGKIVRKDKTSLLNMAGIAK